MALSSGFLANAQTYNVSVETQVGGKIEDRFNFTMQVGQPQYKGFDSKILAKRYRTNGYGHKFLKVDPADLMESEKKNAEVARRQMEIREETGRLQKELTEKIFAEVKGKLERYMGTGDYERYLIAQVRAAKDFAGDDEILIYIDPADIDKKNSIAAAANTTVMVSKYGFGGGIRAVIKSRGILIDQSFETKVKEAADGFVFHL